MKKVFLIILLVAIAYTGFTSIIIVPEKSVTIVSLEHTGEVVQVCGPGVNYVMKGVLFWKICSVTFPLHNRQHIEAVIPIYPLQTLDSTYYSIIVPVSVSYTIDLVNAYITKDSVVNQKSIFLNAISNIVKNTFAGSFETYMRTGYRRNELERDFTRIFSIVFESVKKQCGDAGIVLNDFTLSGMPVFPDERTYNSGLQYLAELRAIEKETKKELIILQGKLKKEQIKNKQLLSKLRAISTLVKDNPDLLRFLYIDKMSGNVKVIISPDKSGFPFGLGFDSVRSKKSPRGEIDNLR
ncbi:MAG TPA: hypothetical protein PK544_01250 [Spirochaetota bacterium]|nr:hypothetical protein [Spirochaetota bacterium]HPQ52382.1 hypothetical protein [Spirochaetota bacterium]